MTEKIKIDLKNLIEEQDREDAHLAEIDFKKISPLYMDLYLQAVEIRKKAAEGGNAADLEKRIELLGKTIRQMSRLLNKNDESEKHFLGFVMNKLGVVSSLLQAKEKAVGMGEPRGMDFLEEEDKKNHHIVLMLEKDKDALTKLSDEDRKLYRKTADLREEVMEGSYADESVVEEIDAAGKELEVLQTKEKNNLFLEFIADQLAVIQSAVNSILKDEK